MTIGSPKHGRVVEPATRGSQAVALKLLGEWQVNEMEGGKNFPSLTGGSFPDYPSDVESGVPPADGLILSGGKSDVRVCVNYTDTELAEAISKAGGAITGWQRIPVKPGDEFKVKWEYAAAHVTRGYHWFITKDGWDESTRITRGHLDPEPFHKDLYTEVPFDQHKDRLVAKTEHFVTLPTNKKGHHVILLAWIVADTGAAFYQAFDVDFQNA